MTASTSINLDNTLDIREIIDIVWGDQKSEAQKVIEMVESIVKYGILFNEHLADKLCHPIGSKYIIWIVQRKLIWLIQECGWNTDDFKINVSEWRFNSDNATWKWVQQVFREIEVWSAMNPFIKPLSK